MLAPALTGADGKPALIQACSLSEQPPPPFHPQFVSCLLQTGMRGLHSRLECHWEQSSTYYLDFILKVLLLFISAHITDAQFAFLTVSGLGSKMAADSEGNEPCKHRRYKN